MSRKTTAALVAAMGFACILTGCQAASPPLPATQTTTADPPAYTERFTVPIAGTAIDFDMVLVPGDIEKGIEPFYIARREVSWQQFYDWMYCADIKDQQTAWRLIEAGLRPSPLQEILATTFQVYDNSSTHPAMGMTYLTAESYCHWLSEMTGRRYRLPTLSEWRRAAVLGGGLPEDFDAAVWHSNNAPQSEFGFRSITTPVGSKSPNAIGIHDLFGSVAEWVTNPQGPALIVGGSISNPPAEISAHWQAEENIDIWSASYPQRPYSRFWYMDYYYSGLRPVCEIQ